MDKTMLKKLLKIYEKNMKEKIKTKECLEIEIAGCVTIIDKLTKDIAEAEKET